MVPPDTTTVLVVLPRSLMVLGTLLLVKVVQEGTGVGVAVGTGVGLGPTVGVGVGPLLHWSNLKRRYGCSTMSMCCIRR